MEKLDFQNIIQILEDVQESIDRTCDGIAPANWKDEDRPEEAWRG
jgi:hypothetical protein